jgi:hypothetical protein
MDEAAIKAEARLLAIEHLLEHLYHFTYKLARLSDQDVEAVHRQALQVLEKDTIPGLDPALSDLWAAEIRDAVSLLLFAISSLRTAEKMKDR